MMKRLVFCLFALCLAFSAWSQQVTLFGNLGLLKFEQYPLKVNRFDFSKVQSLTEEQNLRVCEALDNSRFVMFGAQIKTPQLTLLFNNPSISNSLRGVLDRGGVLFFNPMDWSTVASLPKGMNALFESVGATPVTAKNYVDVSDTKAEKQTVCRLSADVPAMFTSPKDPGEFRAIRHFGSTAGTTWKILAKDKDNRVLAVYNDKASKGTIVFSYLFNVVRTTESAFVENMLTALYGPLTRQSARAKALARGQNAPAATQAVDAIDLRKPVTFPLIDFKTAAVPKFATEVTVRCDNGTLFLHFDCKGGLKAPKAAYTSRDGDIWTDDCVEVMIRDSQKSSSNLYHFILNSANALYDARNDNRAWNSKTAKTSAAVNASGWTADLELSMAELGLGKHFLLNVAREETSIPEVSAWTKTSSRMTVLEAMKTVSLAPEELTATAVKGGSGGVLNIRQVPVFTRVYADAEPAEGEAELETIRFLLPQGDRELAQIVLYNYTDENMEYRLEPEFSPVADMFRFYDVLNWRAVTGQVYAEIMADPNSACVISVPAGETKTFVLAAETEAEPGTYTWSFELVPVNFVTAKRTIKVEAEVLPLRLEKKDMPEVYTFGPYGFSYAHGNPRPLQELLQASHVNYMISSAVPFAQAITKDANGELKLSDKDEDYLTQEVDFLKRDLGWFYSYGAVPDYNELLTKLGVQGYGVMEPKGAAFFESFVARWTAALKRANVPFDRFYVPLKDEPRTDALPELVAAGLILRKYGCRTCNTMATWSTLDDLRTLAPAVSLWIPWEPRITSRATAQEELGIYRASGAPIMPYLCSMSGAFEPYQSYYRFRGIRSHLAGAYKFSLWAANSWRGNPYCHADDKEIKGGFILHHGLNKAVGTLRLEAYREGAEDLYYVHKAAASNNAAAKALAAPEVLNALLAADNPAETQAWRDKLVRALAEK